MLQKEKASVSVSQSLVSEDGDVSIKIPPFYFPLGRPSNNKDEIDSVIKLAKEYMKGSSGDRLKRDNMHEFSRVGELTILQLYVCHRSFPALPLVLLSLAATAH